MSSRITVIVFEPREDNKQAQNELLELLVQRVCGRADVEIVVVPHLVDLAADGPVMRRLREIDGEMAFVGPLQARAIHWLLVKNGLRGPFVEVEQGRAGQLPSEAGQGRAVWCVGTVEIEAGEACGDCLDAMASRLEIAPEGGQKSEVGRIDETTSTRWYPVIDLDRCTNCLECLNFCLFGVYGLDESESLSIDQPDACRPGCPACSRICPEGAIMFPDHHDPAISGNPQASAGGLKLDLSQLFGGADPTALDPTAMAAGERDRALAEKTQDQQQAKQKPTGGTKKTDLDSLVDGLDELDL